MRIQDLFARKRLLFLSTALLAIPLNVFADDDAPPSVQIHGYGTLGYSKLFNETNPLSMGNYPDGTPMKDYGYASVSKDGTFLYNSIMGFNLSYAFSDQLTFYGQLTAVSSIPASGALTASLPVKMDMALLNYRPYDWIDIRVGRQIMPVWMVSEQIDVGLTYPWIRPPTDVYNLAPLKSANAIGFDLKQSFADFIDVQAGVRYGQGTYVDEGNYTKPVELNKAFVGYAEVKLNNMLKLRASYGSTEAIAQTYESGRVKKEATAKFSDELQKVVNAGEACNFAACQAAYAVAVTPTATQAEVIQALQAAGGAATSQAQVGQVVALQNAVLAYGAYVAANPNEKKTAVGYDNSNFVVGKGDYNTLFTFYSFGTTFDWKNLLIMAEYAATNQDIKTVHSVDAGYNMMAPIGTMELRSWYATLAYRLGDFTPHVTYDNSTRKSTGSVGPSLTGRSIVASGSNAVTQAIVSANKDALLAGLVSGTDAALATPAHMNTLTIGLNYNFTPTIVGKLQFEQVRTPADNPTTDVVYFINGQSVATKNIVNMGEAAVSFVF